jgi:sugar phosphate isomerase/epimerase
MLLGCQNSPFHDKDPVEGILELATWRIQSIEFVAEKPRSLPHQIDRASRAEIRKAAEEAGLRLTVHSPFKGQDLTSPFPWKARQSMENAEAALDLAHDLGAVGLVVHPGWGRVVPPVLLPDRMGLLDRVTQRFGEHCPRRSDNASSNSAALGRLLRRARGKRVRIYLENPPRLPNAREVFKESFRRNEDLFLCYDYGHSLLSEWDWLLEEHFDRLAYVHYHLNAGRSDDHKPITEDAQARAFLVRLFRSGFRGTVMIEPSVGDLQGARRSVEAVRSMLNGIVSHAGTGGA